MNLNSTPTKDQLISLFAKCDDTAGHHILYVDYDGNVKIILLPKDLVPGKWASENKDNVKFRLETWIEGNGYTGLKASKNTSWIDRIYKSIQMHWEKETTGYIDSF